MIHSSELKQKHSDILEFWQGPSDLEIRKAAPVEAAGPGDLVFAAKQDQLNQAIASGASVVITSGKLSLPEASAGRSLVFKTPHVGLAMARILPLFDDKKVIADKGSHHPLTDIHPTARIGRDVTIRAFVSIGENAEIGEGSYIGPNTVIGKNAKIGSGSYLHSQVTIGAHCELGKDCEIHPHVTIGSDGFGYAQDASFNHHKLPQLGRVVLGDRVEIGASTAIDRAAFTETRIGSGTKIDNLCHIAHNCEIGENSVIAAGFMTAGSTKIGARFMTGGSTVVADHVTITDGVMLAGRSSVTNDIGKAGAYGGYPLVPMKDHLKTLASLPHLVRLRKQMSRVLKHLNLQDEENA